MEFCVSMNQKEILLCGFDWEENSKGSGNGKDWGNRKEYPWAESGICVFNIVREQRIN